MYYKYNGTVYTVYTDTNGRYGFQINFGLEGSYTIMVSEDSSFSFLHETRTLIQNVLSTLPSTVTLTIVTSIGGSVSPNVGSYVYNYGDIDQVYATPSPGNIFDHFLINGSIRTTANPVFVTMDRDQLVECFFSLVVVTLNVYVTGGGTVTVSPPPVSSPGHNVYTYVPNTLVTLSATPSSGRKLDKWLFDNVNKGSSLNLSVTMDVNHRVDAFFVLIEVQPTTWWEKLLTMWNSLSLLQKILVLAGVVGVTYFTIGGSED